MESTSTEDSTKFNASKYLIKVQGGKFYLPVYARLIWFRQEKPDWGILTDIISCEFPTAQNPNGRAVVKATIIDNTGKTIAQATKVEDTKGFPDFLEKAETGSVGRALAMCGFGTQFCEDDLAENNRLADSPVSRQRPVTPSSNQRTPQGRQTYDQRPAPPRRPDQGPPVRLDAPVPFPDEDEFFR